MKWFDELVENHPQLNIRVAAAKASVQAKSIFWGDNRLTNKAVSEQVPEILIGAYRNSHDQYEKQTIVNLLTNFLDPEPLLRLIEHPSTTSLEAQFLIYYVLSGDFVNVRNVGKHNWPQNSTSINERNIYDDRFYVDESPFGQLLFQSQKKVLERVVAIDKLWDVPTNLFSFFFFFGLPNSRQELRALIDKN